MSNIVLQQVVGNMAEKNPLVYIIHLKPQLKSFYNVD